MNGQEKELILDQQIEEYKIKTGNNRPEISLANDDVKEFIEYQSVLIYRQLKNIEKLTQIATKTKQYLETEDLWVPHCIRHFEDDMEKLNST